MMREFWIAPDMRAYTQNLEPRKDIHVREVDEAREKVIEKLVEAVKIYAEPTYWKTEHVEAQYSVEAFIGPGKFGNDKAMEALIEWNKLK